MSMIKAADLSGHSLGRTVTFVHYHPYGAVSLVTGRVRKLISYETGMTVFVGREEPFDKFFVMPGSEVYVHPEVIE